MAETSSPTPSTKRVITAIYCEESLYSLHLQPSEADSYLKELQLVHSDQKFDVRDIDTGRVSGEEKAAWVSTGAIDFLAATLFGFRRVWRFPNQLTPIPASIPHGTKVGRFMWLTLPLTEEGAFRQAVKHLFGLPWNPVTESIK